MIDVDELDEAERAFVENMRNASDQYSHFSFDEIHGLIAIIDRIAPIPVDNKNYGLLHSPEEPPKPIKLRHKFDARLKKAIRGYYGLEKGYEWTMDDLTMDTTDDEWEVICKVLDAIPFFDDGKIDLKAAYRAADETRAALATKGYI